MFEFESRLKGALCASLSPSEADEIFFSKHSRSVARAREDYCIPCPVKGACYDKAMEGRDVGIWAGEQISISDIATRVNEWELLDRSGDAVLATRHWTEDDDTPRTWQFTTGTAIFSDMPLSDLKKIVYAMKFPVRASKLKAGREHYKETDGVVSVSIPISFGPVKEGTIATLRKRLKKVARRYYDGGRVSLKDVDIKRVADPNWQKDM